MSSNSSGCLTNNYVLQSKQFESVIFFYLLVNVCLDWRVCTVYQSLIKKRQIKNKAVHVTNQLKIQIQITVLLTRYCTTLQRRVNSQLVTCARCLFMWLDHVTSWLGISYFITQNNSALTWLLKTCVGLRHLDDNARTAMRREACLHCHAKFSCP